MKYISRSSRDGIKAANGYFTLAWIGAFAIMAGLGCKGADILTEGSGGQNGSARTLRSAATAS
jgi:hypothetical protein